MSKKISKHRFVTGRSTVLKFELDIITKLYKNA